VSVRKCIDEDATTILSDGSKKKLKHVQVGDKVKTLDSNGQLIDTDVIMLIDKGKENCMCFKAFLRIIVEYIPKPKTIMTFKATFISIRTYSDKILRVSTTHLIPISNGEYKHAKRLASNDTILAYDHQINRQIEEKIKTILIEPVDGYVAPLTMHGTILVNDILTSCYAVVESHALGHSVMAPVRLWYKASNKLNSLLPSSLKANKHFPRQQNNEGIHWYPQLLFSFSKKFLSSVVNLA
jgi:hypothetical protein